MSFNGWIKVKLEDVIDVKHGFAFKGEFFTSEPTENILLTPGNVKIGGGFKGDKFKYYNGEVPLGYILKQDDVIITMTDLSKEGDTIGYSAKVPFHLGIKYLHNQRLGLVQFKSKVVDKEFIYWLLRTPHYQNYIRNSATGTTVRHTSPSRIKEYECYIPRDINVQKQIAAILSSIDDKIELNLQTNQTIEAIAQALFKEWFVDFNFPGATSEMQGSELGEIPKGWKVVSFEEELLAERGLSYKGAGLSGSDAMPMHNLNSVYEGGGYKFEGIKYYSGGFKEKHITRPGDLIIANTEQGHKYLLIGFPAIVPSFFGEVGIFSHHIYRLKAKQGSYLTSEYLYQLLLQPEVREQVVGFANGTTVNMLKIEGLQKPKFILPPNEIVLKYSQLASKFRSMQEENIKLNQTLIQLRDTLLPKLMKGEINVAQAQTQTAAAI